MASDNPASEPAPIDRMVQIRTDPQSLALHVREWPGDRQPFVLVHGLASNARTWDQVACAGRGRPPGAITVDQRGHGLADKPDDGYDFATVAEDLCLLMDELGVDAPILAGQSWGGNVALIFGAVYPERAAGLAFVDGGFIDMQMRPNAAWSRSRWICARRRCSAFPGSTSPPACATFTRSGTRPAWRVHWPTLRRWPTGPSGPGSRWRAT
ncbi:MAG: alpha/beta hydrolase [Caldilineaceae bacterium]